MKKLLLALALLTLLPSFASAQGNPTCPTRPAGDSSNACASTAFVTNAINANDWPIVHSLELYVNSIAGNDANDGLTPATALQHIATAITRVCAFNSIGTNPHILLADAAGTDYHENIGVFGQCGNRNDGLSIIGNHDHPDRTRIIGANPGDTTAQAKDMGILFLTDLTIACGPGGTGIGISSSQLGVVDPTRVTIVGCDNGVPFDLQETGAMNAVDITLSSNALRFFSVVKAASKLTLAGTITCDGIIAATEQVIYVSNAEADTSAVTWSGCGSLVGTNYFVEKQGSLTTGGVTIPGTTGTIDGATFGLVDGKSQSASWTPTDASGAGLSFGSVNASYSRIGNHCVINLVLSYPSTADTSSAQIGGLPCTSITGTASFTGTILSNTTKAVVSRVQGNVAVLEIYDNIGNAATNADVSTRVIRTSITVVAQ